MPLNWKDEPIPSKADKATDILGFKEIGGVGQLYTTLSDSKNIDFVMIEVTIVPFQFAIPDMNRNFQMKMY